MSLLITPTILDQYKFHKKMISPEWIEKSYNDLLNTLLRRYTAPTKNIKTGIDFENELYKDRNLPYCDFYNKYVIIKKHHPTIMIFANILGRASAIQHTVKKFKIIDNVEYCLYGKIDLITNGLSPYDDIDIGDKSVNKIRLHDVKTTFAYREENYTSKIQHLFYLYLTNSTKFNYDIAVFSEETNTVTSVKILDVSVNDTNEEKEKIDALITNLIREFIIFINNDKYMSAAYYNKFCFY